jgi:hypothetical protein
MKGRKLRLYEENKGITDIAGKGVDGMPPVLLHILHSVSLWE